MMLSSCYRFYGTQWQNATSALRVLRALRICMRDHDVKGNACIALATHSISQW